MTTELIQGDCLEILRDLPPDSVDLCILDLPYGETAAHWDTKIDLEELWKQLKRVGKPTTPYFFFGTLKFGMQLIQSNPKDFRYELVWVKNKASGFLQARKMPQKAHEYLFVFYSRLPLYDVESNHTKTQSISYEDKKDVSPLWKTRGTNKDHSALWSPRLPWSVLNFNLDVNKKYKHNTQKPVALLEWIIRYYSRPNDTVLDPTAGSGSTGIACHNLGRKFIGIERDTEIYATAVARINELQK